MLRKRCLGIMLALMMVFGLFVGVAVADETVNNDGDFDGLYLAAPAVAAHLLEEAGLDNYYDYDGGNYIEDVANHMGPRTDFEFPEGNVVSKCNVHEYKTAVTLFLRDLGADVGADLFEAKLKSASLYSNKETFTLNLFFSNEIFFKEWDEGQEISFKETENLNGEDFTWGISDARCICGDDLYKLQITAPDDYDGCLPETGDYVTKLVGIVDSIGNSVIVPEEGVEIKEMKSVMPYFPGTEDYQEEEEEEEEEEEDQGLEFVLDLMSGGVKTEQPDIVERGNALQSIATPVNLTPEDVSIQLIHDNKYLHISFRFYEKIERIVWREPTKWGGNNLIYGISPAGVALGMHCSENKEVLRKGQVSLYFDFGDGEWGSIIVQFNGQGEFLSVNGVTNEELQ